MPTNIQKMNERLREEYGKFRLPLIYQICTLHNIRVRDFAEVFGISKDTAHRIMTHRSLPPLDLAVRIARYFDLDVDSLFAWRVDDDGTRSSLVIELPDIRGRVKLRNYPGQTRITLMRDMAKAQTIPGGMRILAAKLRNRSMDAQFAKEGRKWTEKGFRLT
jgi:DNA-binding XRE family transcriptional regulator